MLFKERAAYKNDNNSEADRQLRLPGRWLGGGGGTSRAFILAGFYVTGPETRPKREKSGQIGVFSANAAPGRVIEQIFVLYSRRKGRL